MVQQLDTLASEAGEVSAQRAHTTQEEYSFYSADGGDGDEHVMQQGLEARGVDFSDIDAAALQPAAPLQLLPAPSADSQQLVDDENVGSAMGHEYGSAETQSQDFAGKSEKPLASVRKTALATAAATIGGDDVEHVVDGSLATERLHGADAPRNGGPGRGSGGGAY